MSGTVIEVEGLASFRSSLKRADKNIDKEFGRAQRELGRLLVIDAKAKARASGTARRHFAGKITMRSNRDGLILGIRDPKMSAAAFWGAKRRTGWYADSRYRKSTRQHPIWVGNGWQAGVKGQGPYALNDAIADNRDRIFDLYSEAVFLASEGALSKQ